MFKEWLHRKMHENTYVRDILEVCHEVPLLITPFVIFFGVGLILFAAALVNVIIHHFVLLLVFMAVFYIVFRIVRWFGGEYKNHQF